MGVRSSSANEVRIKAKQKLTESSNQRAGTVCRERSHSKSPIDMQGYVWGTLVTPVKVNFRQGKMQLQAHTEQFRCMKCIK
jgi:hypothetical protein